MKSNLETRQSKTERQKIMDSERMATV